MNTQRSWCCLDFPSSCSAPLLPSPPPWPLSLLQLLSDSSLSAQTDLPRVMRDLLVGRGLPWTKLQDHTWDYLQHKAPAQSSSPDPAPHLQGWISHLSLSPALTWGSTRALSGNISLGNKALLLFLGKKWENGRNPREGSLCLAVRPRDSSGCEIQTHEDPEPLLEMCLLQEGREKNGNLPERQKGLWK